MEAEVRGFPGAHSLGLVFPNGLTPYSVRGSVSKGKVADNRGSHLTLSFALYKHTYTCMHTPVHTQKHLPGRTPYIQHTKYKIKHIWQRSKKNESVIFLYKSRLTAEARGRHMPPGPLFPRVNMPHQIDTLLQQHAPTCCYRGLHLASVLLFFDANVKCKCPCRIISLP